MIVKKSIELGGKTLTLEAGKVAKQANGAVWATYGDIVTLNVAVAKDEPNEGQDFFPLSVDYREKSASIGKIPGGFFKREGRPSTKEILAARIIDRPIRPMFTEGFFNETSINCNVYSSDGETEPDVICAIGASAALLISDIPFEEPIAEVRVTRLDGEFLINPTYAQLEKGDFDIVVAGTTTSVVMVEGESKEVSEDEMLNAIKFAHEQIARICEFQKEFRAEAGMEKKQVVAAEDETEMIAEITAMAQDEVTSMDRTLLTKHERNERNKALRDGIIKALEEKYPEKEQRINAVIDDIEYKDMRKMILEEKRRLDGRGLTDIRPITCEVAVLPRTHGSALFTRGETQSLTTLTLGTKSDEQIIESLITEETNKRFMLHYNFPSFSTGEVSGRPGPSRREIGHGNLAERALKNMLPPEEEFPYTIRVVSDILESNGSSSMATVCAGSLALMDGGVKMKKPIAGIAMGLIKEDDDIVILSDILGTEDHYGDMDFKVAGSEDGVTAIQMDIKIQGISFEIMERALRQAKEGRMHILGIMKQTLSEGRDSISQYAPQLTTIFVDPELIGAIIGPGGKNIKSIIAESKAEIDIDDSGKVVIAALSKESADKAISLIEEITAKPEIGKVYEGTVKFIKDFGAIVEFMKGKEGLLHISEIDVKRTEKVSDVFKIGDKVQVKLIGIDDMGKNKLSRRVLLPGGDKPNPSSDRPRRRESGGDHHKRSGGGFHRDGGRGSTHKE
ncbi:MAG TPA: polyribonucleotide nucleotidyltransferase [Ignavibacteria bacterium]|nr:polyribonucleotide nucleotidyltransferase [Ignavibacteria bacterium]